MLRFPGTSRETGRYWIIKASPHGGTTYVAAYATTKPEAVEYATTLHSRDPHLWRVVVNDSRTGKDVLRLDPPVERNPEDKWLTRAKSRPQIRHGIYYYPTRELAEQVREEVGGERVVEYQYGYAVQRYRSGPYWGPEGWGKGTGAFKPNPADRFDVIEATFVLAHDYGLYGVIDDLQTRLQFRPRPSLSYDTLSEDAKEVYAQLEPRAKATGPYDKRLARTNPPRTVFGLWYGGGGNYGTGGWEDIESFPSVAAAKRALADRRGSRGPHRFNYVNKKPGRWETPVVGDDSEMWLWGYMPDEGRDLYPGSILKIGPRGGVVEEPA